MGLWRKGRAKPPATPADDGESMAAMRRASSLPSGVFQRVDAGVEKALSGPVADVFLSHMQAPAPHHDEAEEDDVPPPPARDQVSPQEIEVFLVQYAKNSRARMPDIHARLDTERTWVLADLSVNGSSRARELATRELRELLTQMKVGEHIDLELLQTLVLAIERGGAKERASVLLQTLLSGARETLERIARGADA